MYEKLLKKQPKHRQEVILQLQAYLQNMGKFTTFVLGNRGTGKTFWIEQILKAFYPQIELFTVNAALSESNVAFWHMAFATANKHTLVIDNVEKLSKTSQEIVFEMLSTTNGKYGISQKAFDVRIIFTSCFDISALRDSEEFLLHHFYDRISQLVVQFPSFSDKDIGIWKDFEATWEKMKFGKAYPCPNEVLQNWLEQKSQFLFGNFRDLDKIAINWQQYQLNGLTDEKEILNLVTAGFNQFFHYPEQKTELHNTFEFKKGKNKDELEKEWRSQFKQWAKIEYGSLQNAAKKLQMSYRTFEKW